RAAQGLLAGKDKRAIPSLIALLEVRSITIAWQAEELLHYVAGSTAPKELLASGKDAEQRKCRAAWEKWWNSYEKKIDLERLDQEARRPCLVLAFGRETGPSGKGRVWLCGCSGKPRWEMSNSCAITD